MSVKETIDNMTKKVKSAFRKEEPKEERKTLGEWVASSFNTLYQDVVNDREKQIDINSDKYMHAKSFVDSRYSKLNDGVMLYLAHYMEAEPNGNIEFTTTNSKNGVLGLRCMGKDAVRSLVFNEKGVIVFDVTEKRVQKQEASDESEKI